MAKVEETSLQILLAKGGSGFAENFGERGLLPTEADAKILHDICEQKKLDQGRLWRELVKGTVSVIFAVCSALLIVLIGAALAAGWHFASRKFLPADSLLYSLGVLCTFPVALFYFLKFFVKGIENTVKSIDERLRPRSTPFSTASDPDLEIKWHEEAEIYGVKAKYLKLEKKIELIEESIKEVIPGLDHHSLSRHCGESNFYFGNIAAQPDLVYKYHNGFVVIEYKSRSGEGESDNLEKQNNSRGGLKDNWTKSVRLSEMLQAIIYGRVVAVNMNAPVACLLVYNNAILLLVPPEELVRTALNYTRFVPSELWRNNRVAAGHLAKLAAPFVDIMHDRQKPQTEASKRGDKEHARVLGTNRKAS